jgi:hypothetical protein
MLAVKNVYGFIYITTNLINGKKYIGQKKLDDASRWKSYLGSGYHLNNAIQKYGKTNFSREIVDIASSEYELNSKEFEWIDKYNAVENANFYNMIEGGSVQESLSRKNSIPVICIYNGFVFKSIRDASIWSGQTVITIRKTFERTHSLSGKNDQLIFRPLSIVLRKNFLCCICGNNYLKKSNSQKMCDACFSLKKSKFKLIVNHDFEKSNSKGIEILKFNDEWVRTQIHIFNKEKEKPRKYHKKNKTN